MNFTFFFIKLLILPVLKLSSTIISFDNFFDKALLRWLPIKPQPPVIIIFFYCQYSISTSEIKYL